MEKINSLTKTYQYKQFYNAAPETVFPLLCFNREYEWIDGWECKLIRSDSGYMEQDCVFISYVNPNGQRGNNPERMEMVWNVYMHDKEKYVIKSVNYIENLLVLNFKIELTDEKNGTTTALFEHKYCGLHEKGNEFIDKIMTEDAYNNSQKFLEKSMNYFLENGKLFKL